MIPTEHLGKAIDELAPRNRPIMLHASLRSFGAPIEGGVDTLLDAFLAGNRTVLVPTFTEPQFGVAPPAGLRPLRNGIDYSALPAVPTTLEGTPYTTDCGLINPGLGVLPAAVISRTGAVRGTHPLNSFAALGPLAGELISAQSPSDVYGPLRELAAHEGVIILAGVGINRMTAIHLAEHQAGRRLFLRWARNLHHQVSMVEVGSCSEGFPRLGPTLRPHVRTAVVGGSRWQAFPARQTIAAAAAAIRADQSITRCADGDCLLCRDSIAGGPMTT
ncbi:AAC(3) family N-acetyltransferase [Amycolatopsis sp. NBC_01307]|uniref:AAC(3) family N-acetyltransferase n=1 Tax=Amycolatopsis sp. NBC_01307 TaxID=2903561 RepID=UPI002E0E94FB|nr:AAC(3) family N-acetyltransferase [Amycolatopsis sp. NBC_01307]